MREHQVVQVTVRLAFLIQYSSRAELEVFTKAQCTESLPHLRILFMQTINRFLYGPTSEERVRAWQGKLRQESRVLDREMRQVWLLAANGRALVLTCALVRYRDK